MAPTVLVVDDDAASRRLLAAIFEGQGMQVVLAEDARSGREQVEVVPVDLVVLDVHLPDADGLELLAHLRRAVPDVPVIMLTADADVKTAVLAIRAGAFDYLTKPIDPEEVAVTLRRALETRALQSEVENLRRQLGETGSLAAQMGPSEQVRAVTEQVRTVARTDFSVLILGETGTGKELVAQAIHRQSGRRMQPFIAVDCGAIPEALLESELFGHEKGAFTGADRRREGRFRVAEGGSLFLDEIGNLPLGLQAKLLRVLESRKLESVGSTHPTAMNVRFLAATNDDLQARVTAGKFRADLFFRLAQYTISLPPLRERPSDVAYLARRFLEEVSFELRRPTQEIAPEACALLERHRWPGNVRELRNVVRQAVLESSELELRRAHVQKFLRGSEGSPRSGQGASAERSLRETAEAAAREAERHAICEMLRQTRGNKSRAARALATDYKTLHLKMKALGIRARDFIP
jgi:two-component system nitrogen regulation response regulator GlnG